MVSVSSFAAPSVPRLPGTMRRPFAVFAIALFLSLHVASGESSSPANAEAEPAPSADSGGDRLSALGSAGKGSRWAARQREVVLNGQRVSVAFALVLLFFVVRCVAALRPSLGGIRRLADDESCASEGGEAAADANGNTEESTQTPWRQSVVPESIATGDFIYQGERVTIREDFSPDAGRRYVKVDYRFAGSGIRKLRATVDKKKKISKLVLVEDDEKGNSVKLTRVAFDDSPNLQGKIIEEIETPTETVTLQYFVLADGRDHAMKTTKCKTTGRVETITQAQQEDGRYAIQVEGVETDDSETLEAKIEEAMSHVRSMIGEAEEARLSFQEVTTATLNLDPVEQPRGADDGEAGAERASVASITSIEDAPPEEQQEVQLPPLELDWERQESRRGYDSFLRSDALITRECNPQTGHKRTKIISLKDSTVSIVETRSADESEVLLEYQGQDAFTGKTKVVKAHYEKGTAKIEKQVIGVEDGAVTTTAVFCSGITGDWTKVQKWEGDAVEDGLVLQRTAVTKATTNVPATSETVDALCVETQGMLIESAMLRRHMKSLEEAAVMRERDPGHAPSDASEWQTLRSQVVRHPDSGVSVLFTQMARPQTHETATVVQTETEGEASLQEVVNSQTGARELAVTIRTDMAASQLNVFVNERELPGQKKIKRVSTRGHTTLTLDATLSAAGSSLVWTEESEITGSRVSYQINVDENGEVTPGTDESAPRVDELFSALQSLETEAATFEDEMSVIKDLAAPGDGEEEEAASESEEDADEDGDGDGEGGVQSRSATVTDDATGEAASVTLFSDANILFESITAELETASGDHVSLKKTSDGMSGETIWSRETLLSGGVKETVEVTQSLGGARSIRQTREDKKTTISLIVNVQETGALDVRERFFDKTKKKSKVSAAAVSATGEVKTTAAVTSEAAETLVEKAKQAKDLAKEVEERTEALGKKAKEASG